MSRGLTQMILKSARAGKIIARFSDVKILVLGDLMLDRYLWGNVERISPEAPVPVVHIYKEDDKLGGAANVAANVKALGGQAFLLGVVGDDQYADLFKKRLVKSGLSVAGLIKDSDRPTIVKTRVVAHSQQVVRIDRENISEISAAVSDKLLAGVKKRIDSVDAVIISDYGKGVITCELLSELIQTANRAGKIIAVDPKEVHFMNYRDVTVITPNHHEAGFVSGRKITNDSILTDVGWNLLDLLNLESLLITRGEKGMALFEKDRTITAIPAEAKTVYDVTGAGDTVIAALTVARSAGASMKEAAFLANIAAGLAVAQFGTARISREELLHAVNSK